MRPDLHIAPCDNRASEYAVKHWHYTRTMPMPPMVRFGAWEDGAFIGTVIFSRGANKNLSSPYGLKQTEVCELTRVALAQHRTPTSRIVALCLKQLKAAQAGLRLCISFADANQGHVGTLYQAGGWIYLGRSSSTPKFRTPEGRILHQRQVSRTGYKPQFGKMTRVPTYDECEVIFQADKYRYAYALDGSMKQLLAHKAHPYPRASRLESEAPGVQPGSEGAAMRPTRSTSLRVAHG